MLPLLQDAHLSVGSAAQLIGKVNPDLAIKVLSSVKFDNPVGKLLSRLSPHAWEPWDSTK